MKILNDFFETIFYGVVFLIAFISGVFMLICISIAAVDLMSIQDNNIAVSILGGTLCYIISIAAFKELGIWIDEQNKESLVNQEN